MPIGTSPQQDPARLLAREVLIHGPITRGELGRRLGLSPATLTRLTRPLLDSGVVVEAPEAAVPAFGRPSRPLDVPTGAGRYIGIKITTERAYAVLTDVRARPLAETSAALAGTEPARVVPVLHDLIARLRGESTLSAVGIGLGGTSPDRRIVGRDEFLDWSAVPLADLVEAGCKVPVIVENDVVALAEAEHWFGSARGLDDFAVLTIGAGVGYALVQHGRQIVGERAGAGAHVPLEASGHQCADGHPGCSSVLLSVPYLCEQAGSRLGSVPSAGQLHTLIRAGDPAVTEVMATARRRLARLLTMCGSLAMVDTIVLAGEGVEFFLVDGELSITDEEWPFARPLPRLVIDMSGFNSWARGAAAVAIQTRFADAV